MKLKSRFSIQPGSFPFFYGYVIAVIGTIGIWASLPGQTVGVSTFTDPVMNALGLTRDQFSIAYMAGTVLSSFILTYAGKIYDQKGATFTGTLAALLLGITLLLCSFSDVIAGSIGQIIGISHWIVPFSLMVILFFMLRFSGQGVLTMVSRNMVMKWFDHHRGRINAFSSVSVSLGFSASPIFIDMLIQSNGWSGAWHIMALSMIGIIVLILLFYKDSPEKYGLIPDGGPQHKTSGKGEQTKVAFTLGEAKRTRAYWIYALTLSFYSFFVTGLTFHVVSVFNTAGYARTEAISIFLPVSVISVSCSLIANFISDWIRLKILLFAMIGGAFAAAVGLLGLNDGWGIYLLIGGAGVMGGLFAALMSITWPRFFGRKYLGAISGNAMSMLVFASALGPVLFSLSNTYLTTYEGVSWISLAFLVIITIGAVKANPPVKQ